MYLKRLYIHDAPKKEWVNREEGCQTCRGSAVRGVVVNAAGDGVEPCPTGCDEGVLIVQVPPCQPVVEVLNVNPNQNFWTSLIAEGERWGWLERDHKKGQIVVHSSNVGDLTFHFDRPPGTYWEKGKNGKMAEVKVTKYDCHGGPRVREGALIDG